MNASSEGTVRPVAGSRWTAAPLLNVAGLLATAAGMVIQIAAGSTLYPSLAGPIVLVATALIVAFRPGRWTALLGLIVPLVLGIGAIAAAVMTGGFTRQLTDIGNPGIVAGSLLHVTGLIGAIVGGAWMLRSGRYQG